MKQKFTSFVLIPSFVFFHCGFGEVLITVNGIFNESVTLPTGSPYTSPSEVIWTINKRVTAWYFAPDTVEMDTERFGHRIHLNKGNGYLLIRSAKMEDADIYTVEVTYSGGTHLAHVKLIIYEKVDMPILEVLSNISGPRFCNVSVRCASHHGQWVESLCEVTESKIMCQVTDRNDSAHSTVLRITETKDAINCSSSNPASTSSAPLLPVTRVCNAHAPDPARKTGPTNRSRTWLLVLLLMREPQIDLIDLRRGEPNRDSNDL
ncbi:hypothetical protein GJAV_G00090540 [Gymnothorax javanicus]|nr:hypothetical protein GJAV_G00090540 [Gymnothorax javanicus]